MLTKVVLVTSIYYVHYMTVVFLMTSHILPGGTLGSEAHKPKIDYYTLCS